MAYKNKSICLKENSYWISSILSSLAVTLMGALVFLWEGDCNWQLLAGEYFFTNGVTRMPVDVFSWYAQDHGIGWTAHSWAADVLIYLITHLLNDHYVVAGFVYFCATTFITMFLISRATVKNMPMITRSPLLSMMIVLLPAIMLVAKTPRAQNFGYVLFAWMLLIFTDLDENEDSWMIWWTPLLVVLWANFHGGDLLLIAIYAATYAITGAIQLHKGIIQNDRHGPKYFKKLIFSLLCVPAFGWINPYGFKLFMYPITENTSACKEGVAEWQPTSFGNGLLFFILAAVFFAIILLSGKKYSLMELVGPGSMLVGTLVYLRCQSLFGIALSLFIAKTTEPRNVKKLTSTEQLASYALAVFCILGCSISILQDRQKTSDNIHSADISQDMIQKIKEINPQRIYNDYNDGSQLMFNGIKCFIDSRADLYPEKVLRDGKLLGNDPISEDVNLYEALEEYQFDALLIPSDSVTGILLENEGYQLALDDGTRCLYVGGDQND